MTTTAAIGAVIFWAAAIALAVHYMWRADAYANRTGGGWVFHPITLVQGAAIALSLTLERYGVAEQINRVSPALEFAPLYLLPFLAWLLIALSVWHQRYMALANLLSAYPATIKD